MTTETYNVTKNGMTPYHTTSDAAEAIAACDEANRTVCPGHAIYRQSDGARVVDVNKMLMTPEDAEYFWECEYRATWLPPPHATHGPVPSPVGAWGRVTIGDNDDTRRDDTRRRTG